MPDTPAEMYEAAFKGASYANTTPGCPAISFALRQLREMDLEGQTIVEIGPGRGALAGVLIDECQGQYDLALLDVVQAHPFDDYHVHADMESDLGYETLRSMHAGVVVATEFMEHIPVLWSDRFFEETKGVTLVLTIAHHEDGEYHKIIEPMSWWKDRYGPFDVIEPLGSMSSTGIVRY